MEGQMNRATVLRASCILAAGSIALTTIAAQDRTQLIGTIRDADGAPIVGADVGVAAARLLVQSDSGGRFVLRGVPAGATRVTARRLGYTPVSHDVIVAAGASDSVALVMTAQPLLLATVQVSEREMRRQIAIEEFYRRRIRSTGGVFITREDIDDRHASRLSDVLRGVPGIAFVRSRGGNGIRLVTSSVNRRDCVPQYWVDGVRMSNVEIDDFSARDVEGLEVYHGPATTPMRFSQGSVTSCGTVVIWTRVPGA
jgi:carboxypeptidase family protein/TonB-dependent receptor-like protein